MSKKAITIGDRYNSTVEVMAQ